MKKSNVILSEYVRKLSDEDLYFLGSRFKQNLSGDVAAITLLIQRDQSVDKLLSGASGAAEWFEMFDEVGRYVKEEYGHRAGMDTEAEVA